MSIIHHYSTEPKYPQSHCGFALSGGLLQRLMSDLQTNPLRSQQTIEPVWELAKWIQGVQVDISDRRDTFCAEEAEHCATWVRDTDAHRDFGNLSPAEVVIGVKTVEKFHESRIPLIREFWGKASLAEVVYLSNKPFSGETSATHVDLSVEFGDAVDPAREATSSGSGHCSKMQALLQHLWRHRSGKRWYVVTDDDTLLNVPRLLQVLASYDDREPFYVGERYGWSHTRREGTNYITTGGGMALSSAALDRLMSCNFCVCPSADAPDDMTLGQWFKKLGVPATHEEGFHQAEPHNYHPEILQHAEVPISFHRFAVRVPANTPQEEVNALRRKNWRTWSTMFFRASDRQEL